MHRYAYGLETGPAAADECHWLVEGVNLISGIESFRSNFGGVTSLERDLLQLSAAVFAADRASPRGDREQYRRFIDLRVAVSNFDQISPLGPALNRLLRRLSQDVWTVSFVPRSAVDGSDQTEARLSFEVDGGKTLLFSGGLDSLAGAVEFGKEETPLLLSSHITRNPATDGAQRELVDLLTANGFNVEHRHFFVSSRNGGPTGLDHQREPSQRTRSFVFLTLAILAARRTRRSEIVAMAENGQMAIHLPLSSARIGAFSTHTAHPTVLAQAQQFFRQVLEYPISIHNPYVYKTKAEVVQPICLSLPSSIPISTSCWKNSRPMANGARHCGDCVPCLIRRIALETHGQDATLYATDLLQADIETLPPDNEGRRNLVELCEFIVRFQNHGNNDLHSEFPELISADFDDGHAIAMYRRFASEAGSVLGKYSNLAWLLQ